jgi:hypothetical protein
VDPAHVKSRGAGGPDHGNLIPACRWKHHREHDTIGIGTFALKYGVDTAELALAYEVQYQRERARR